MLRDVLGFDSAEVASMLGASLTAVKGTLQRARAALGHPGQASPAADRHGPPRRRERALARRFADAYVAADIDGDIALLTDDAWLSMPPAPHQYHGTAAIRSMLAASFRHRASRCLYLLPAQANTQPALAGYLSDPARVAAYPAGLFVLTMAGPKIRALTRFHLDELYPRFGLPGSLPEPPGTGYRAEASPRSGQ